MKVILHDLDIQYHEILSGKCDEIIHADGKYAPCQGCFGCWTKHPAECFMKDRLKQSARVIGQADELAFQRRLVLIAESKCTIPCVMESTIY